MFIKLFSIKKSSDGSYYLSEVRVNVSHISFITENQEYSKLLREGKMGLDLSPMVKFSNLSLNSSGSGLREMVVVGEPEIIESKMLKSRKQLLRG